MGSYLTFLFLLGVLTVQVTNADERPCISNFTVVPGLYDSFLPILPCTLDLASPKDFYIFFEDLHLDSNDKFEIITEKNSSIKTTALPILALQGNITISIEGESNHYPRRMRFELADKCEHTYTFYVPEPIKIQAPFYFPSSDGNFSCSLKFNTTSISYASLSISLLEDGLIKNNLIANHSDGKVEILKGAKHDFIEKADTVLTFGLIRSADSLNDSVILEMDPVNKDCSGEIIVMESKSTSVTTTMFDPNLECRYVVTTGKNDYTLVGRIISLNSTSTGYLNVLAGGTKRTDPLFLLGSNSMSYYEGEYFLPDPDSKSFLLRFNYLRNISFGYSLIDGESGHIDSKDGNLEFLGDNKTNLYLLHGDVDQNVLLTCPTLSEGTLSVYGDFKEKAFLLNLTKGENFPMVSPSSLMMVKAAQFKKEFNCSVRFTKEGCNKMSLGKAGSYSFSSGGECPANCAWSVPPQEKGNLLLSIFNLTLREKDSITLSSGIKTLLTLNKTVDVPRISIPLKDGLILRVHQEDSKAPGLQLEASYLTEPDCYANEGVDPGKEVVFTSPDFPNSYPLNSQCLQVAKANQLLLSIDSLSLAPSHCLTLVDGSNKSLTIKNASSPDLLLSSSATLNFTGFDCTKPNEALDFTKPYSGYKLTLRGADCGEALSITSPKEITLMDNKATYCIWTLSIPQDKNIFSYNVTAPKVGTLTIYDGKSIRNKSLDIKKDKNDSLSLTNHLIVVYAKEKNAAKEGNFTMKLNIFQCTEWCNVTTLCMHPDWKCNGKNDCGDWSDELNCTGPTPAPPPSPSPCPKTSSGWTNASFAAAIILSLIFGCALAYGLPRAYRRYRANTYQPFSSNLE